MPEMLFRVRWPNGAVADCYSPSTVILQFLAPTTEYALTEFLERSRRGLTAASDRVRARYGHPCSRAAAQLAVIEREAARHAEPATVTVLAVEAL